MITGYDHATAMRLYAQGYNDRELAESLKMSPVCVVTWQAQQFTACPGSESQSISGVLRYGSD
jgi:alkyl sulfatase BDS1-like metallo-beta-lactamase superfamily hydrolase